MPQTKLEKAIEHHKVDNGMTNDDVAATLGISRMALYSKVRGDTPFNIQQAKALADMLGMSLEELYGISPAPTQ